MDIALLEDNPSDAKLIKLYLESYGHACKVFTSGQCLIDEFLERDYPLLLIDWELPDISGDRILHWVRETVGHELPIIFITARDSTEDIVAMLDAGADDYMTKPVRLEEMLARITALVRRSLRQDKFNNAAFIEPYSLDFGCHRISRDGVEIALTPKEFELARYLLQNIGDLLSRNKLLHDIWGYGPEIHTRTIDIHISRIRKKLELTEQHGWKLTSIYQKGYRLERVPLPG
jgi:DNA-binding response OmpR family regulator